MPASRVRKFLLYCLIVFGSVMAGAVAAEVYLTWHASQRLNLPFYNILYPYVMFRPIESYTFETKETFAMSHFKSRVFVYTNEDGFRIPAAQYKLPKEKPAGQFRIAFLGGSLVELSSTFDTGLPGSLRTVLRERYPGRDIEVINAGIQSCVSRQSLVQLLLTVVDYHPDMVILYDGGNDLGLPLTYESRANFPYNFQAMQEAWDLYRADRQQSLWRLALERSNLYRLVRARLHPDERKMTPTADAPFAGTNALPAGRILSDAGFVQHHVAEYLSNWRKLVELSAAYHYQPVCVLSPAGGFQPEHAVPVMMKSFHLDRATATDWLKALQLLYGEAGRQIGEMRGAYPAATFIDLSQFLDPPDRYFWDLGHVYDEANMVLAQRIYPEIKASVERGLREAGR
ncbi:MAG TPA: SGNH/GDSL hydrolase family protein [Bryobacteraceae bacterium]|nr:SGNH/GDSL hydrolase family protein [Bryobacteraceae bacterium]